MKCYVLSQHSSKEMNESILCTKFTNESMFGATVVTHCGDTWMFKVVIFELVELKS